MIQVIKIEKDDKRWRSFLERNDHLVFHTPEYHQFMSAAFKNRFESWAAVKDGEIQTILPVNRIKHVLFGSMLISTAFQEYGGPCGDPQYLADIVDRLSFASSRNHRFLELRFGLEGLTVPLRRLFEEKDHYKRFVLSLSDEETVWKNIKREKRKAVRGAEKMDVVIKPLPFEDMDIAYDLYCRNMRAFGSPPFSMNFFLSFHEHLVKRGMGKIFASYFQGRLISFLLGFTYRDRAHIIISVSDPAYLNLRPNDAMHWAFIKHALEMEFLYFDFGRVRVGSGQFDFKKKWGAEALSLPHYFLLWRGKSIPHVDPHNPAFKLLTNVWRRLPLGLVKRIGPGLREGLGI